MNSSSTCMLDIAALCEKRGDIDPAVALEEIRVNSLEGYVITPNSRFLKKESDGSVLVLLPKKNGDPEDGYTFLLFSYVEGTIRVFDGEMKREFAFSELSNVLSHLLASCSISLDFYLGKFKGFNFEV